MNQKRIIIAGTGSIGIRHARVCSRFPELKVELCDPRPEGLVEAKATLGSLRCWRSWEDAVASGPDMAIIATPHDLHSKMTCQAMENGIHVLCEKPMSHSSQEAARMAATATATNTTLRIGFMLRFLPLLSLLQEFLAGGSLGTLVSLRYHIGSLITLENSRSRYQNHLEGALVMDYVHGLDLLLWLTNLRPCGIYACARRADGLSQAADPNLVAAILDFPEPILAEIHMDYAAKPQLHELTVIGTDAMVRIELSEGKMEIRRRAENRVEEIHRPLQVDNLYTDQITAFLDAVSGKESACCTAEEGVLSTALMENLLEAARLGLRLPLPSELSIA